VLDFMCEYRKDSEVIIVSKNKKGSLNQILLMVDLIKKVDLNLKKLVYKNSSEEKENKEVIERIKEITKLEYEII
jgi:cytosolic thymidine kinase